LKTQLLMLASTIRDRVVQASLKLVLEPVFETDFHPCSYGFRPGRRVHDTVAEVRFLTSHSYEWIVEGDIKACFDEISHPALMDRVRARVGDKRILALVKAFLKAGILTEDGALKDTDTGTPQGGLCSAEHNDPWGFPPRSGRTGRPRSRPPAATGGRPAAPGRRGGRIRARLSRACRARPGRWGGSGCGPGWRAWRRLTRSGRLAAAACPGSTRRYTGRRRPGRR
jgi:hypothetical protein